MNEEYTELELNEEEAPFLKDQQRSVKEEIKISNDGTLQRVAKK